MIRPPNPFLDKLARMVPLTADDRILLGSLAARTHAIKPRVDILLEGEQRDSLVLVVSGWACLYKYLENGARQIVSLLLPGDLCQPFGSCAGNMAYSLGTLTAAVIAYIKPAALRQVARMSDAIEVGLWWDSLLKGDIQNEHVVSLGRRSAQERLGHFFCELYMRLSLAGLVDRPEFEMPMTQTEIADLLGLSAVHVNRSLQDLRAQGLVFLRNGHLVIHKLPELMEISQFDPGYLHLKRFPGATSERTGTSDA